MNERILTDLEKVLEVNGVVHVTQPEQMTPTVDKMLEIFHKQWNKTADECIKRAEELEAEAADLRSRANSLVNSCDYLNDVRQSVLFEIESRNRAASLALVNPKDEA